MKNLARGILAVSLLFSNPAWAKSESWYWGFGLGYAAPSYPSALQTQVDSVKNTSGVSHTAVAVDLGFHWPVGSHTTLGATINGASDRYSMIGEVSIIQTGLFMTAIHSFGSAPIEGIFLRGDIGLGRLGVDSGGVSAVSNYGLGLIGGLGWALPVSDGTRLVLQATYGYRHVEGENYNLFAITFGPMF